MKGLSSVCQPVAVLLPERFRGGCAFGSGAPAVVSRVPISPARVAGRDAGEGGGSQGGVGYGSRSGVAEVVVGQEAVDLAGAFVETGLRLKRLPILLGRQCD